ncbi:MAG: uroporphyrinogen decarboxylase family protein [Candidatus Limnocylindrales bacterium]
MNSRERVLAALRREEPDRVPYCEEYVSRPFAERLMGWGSPLSESVDLEGNEYTVEEAKAVARRLKLDNITFLLRAPVFAEKHPGQDGILYYGAGLIRTVADLDRVRLPDPLDDRLYESAEAFAAQKDEFSAWFNTRIGIFSTMLSLGLEGFSLALYDDRVLIERLLDIYTDWIEVVADRACRLGFDVFVSTDDFAFKTAPFFSPAVFRELVLPRYRRVAKKITLPWLLHSDGNISPFLDDLLSVGIAGAHPMEPGAMDIRAVKRDYGDRLCVVGNVDINLLSLGTEETVDDEVRGLIRDVAPGGGYIISSGNSLTGYCQAKNVVAMSEAVQRYGRYPIAL